MFFSIRDIGEDNAMTLANGTTGFRGKFQTWFNSPLKLDLTMKRSD